MNEAIIGVGSNIDPEINIQKAKKMISQEMKLKKSSKFKVTKPVGFIKQPDFYNGAWLIETPNNLEALKILLHNIEDKLKRVRTDNKFGPRTIDLDVIVWNKNIIDEDVYSRDFLKQSVLELCPELAKEISA